MEANEPCAVGANLKYARRRHTNAAAAPCALGIATRLRVGRTGRRVPHYTGAAAAACAEPERDGGDRNHCYVPVVHRIPIDMTDADAAFDEFCDRRKGSWARHEIPRDYRDSERLFRV